MELIRIQGGESVSSIGSQMKIRASQMSC